MSLGYHSHAATVGAGGYYTTTPNTFAPSQGTSMGASSSGTAAINVTNGVNMTMSHATINTTSQYNVQFNNTHGSSTKGSMRFDTANGNIEVYDGSDWVIVAGLDDASTRLERIINVLLADYPEVAADLVLRGEIE